MPSDAVTRTSIVVDALGGVETKVRFDRRRWPRLAPVASMAMRLAGSVWRLRSDSHAGTNSTPAMNTGLRRQPRNLEREVLYGDVLVVALDHVLNVDGEIVHSESVAGLGCQCHTSLQPGATR